MPSGANAKMKAKQNVVLYLDKEVVDKSRKLGFNLSRTCETHLKQLILMFSNSSNFGQNFNKWAGPDLNRRPLARKANVLTKLDDRPTH